MPAKQKPTTETTKTLVVVTTSRLRKITVPSSAKVTLSPLVPSSKANYSGDAGVALRIYRNATEQIAVIRNVIEFWEEGLPMKELVVEVNGQSKYVTSNEKNSMSKEEMISKKWIDTIN
jgi:hypothetical protein